jgi:hypothetical protein
LITVVNVEAIERPQPITNIQLSVHHEAIENLFIVVHWQMRDLCNEMQSLRM